MMEGVATASSTSSSPSSPSSSVSMGDADTTALTPGASLALDSLDATVIDSAKNGGDNGNGNHNGTGNASERFEENEQALLRVGSAYEPRHREGNAKYRSPLENIMLRRGNIAHDNHLKEIELRLDSLIESHKRHQKKTLAEQGLYSSLYHAGHMASHGRNEEQDGTRSAPSAEGESPQPYRKHMSTSLSQPHTSADEMSKGGRIVGSKGRFVPSFSEQRSDVEREVGHAIKQMRSALDMSRKQDALLDRSGRDNQAKLTMDAKEQRRHRALEHDLIPSDSETDEEDQIPGDGSERNNELTDGDVDCGHDGTDDWSLSSTEGKGMASVATEDRKRNNQGNDARWHDDDDGESESDEEASSKRSSPDHHHHRHRRQNNPTEGRSSRPITRLLGEELSHERQKRLVTITALKDLGDELKKEQARTRTANSRLETVMETVAKLEESLSAAVQKNKRLSEALRARERALDDKDVTLRRRNHVIEELKRESRAQSERFQEQAAVINGLKDDVQKLKIAHMEKLQISEMEALSLQNQGELSKQALKRANKIIKKLQSALAEKEQRHTREMDGLVSLTGPEVQRVVLNRERELKETFSSIKQTLEKELEETKRRLVELKGKHATTKEYEAERFNGLLTDYDMLKSELTEVNAKFRFMKEENLKSTELLESMAQLIQEQKGKLQSLHGDNARLAASLEAAREEARLINLQRDGDKKVMAKMTRENQEAKARVEGLTGLLEGLKAQKALWAEELAQQGAALSAERGTLEAKIKEEEREKERLNKALREADKVVNIKEKLLVDQSDELEKLRKKVTELTKRSAEFDSKYREKENVMHDKLQVEREISQQLQQDLELEIEKKTKAREKASRLAAEADNLRAENAQLKRAWDETNKKLGDIEMKIQGKEQSLDARLRQAEKERDEANQHIIDLNKHFHREKLQHDDKMQALLQQKKEVVDVLEQTREELETSQAVIAQLQTDMAALKGQEEARQKEQEQRLATLKAALQAFATPSG